MANDVFDITKNLSIRYFNSSISAFVEIVADSFEVEIDRGIDVENGVFAEGSVGTATIRMVKRNLSDFLGTPGYKAGQQIDIRYQPTPDTNPLIWNYLYNGWIQNVSMSYINESGLLQVTIVANDSLKVFQNTQLASFSVTGTVTQRSFRNCMITLAAAVNAATTYPGGITLNALGAGASATTQRAFTWLNTSAGEIASKFMDAELGWYFSNNSGGIDYLARTDIDTLQATAWNNALPKVSNIHYTDIMTNGTFEVNTTGWTPGTNVTLTRDTTQFYAGVASMRANATTVATANWTCSTNTTMTVSAGQKMMSSVWVKAQSNTSNARVVTTYYNSGGTIVGTDTGAYTPVNTTGWTQIQVVGVAPIGTVRAMVTIGMQRIASGTASVWVDNAKLENLTTISTNHFCLEHIDLDYDSDFLVNKVTVIDATAGTKTTASNTTSITANGEQSGVYTVDFDPAGASTYATWASHVVNAATIKQVSGVTVPVIRDDGRTSDIATYQVGRTLQVEFANEPLPTLQVVSIISRINHFITADSWEMNIRLWRGI